jgi:hypothetical protein
MKSGMGTEQGTSKCKTDLARNSVIHRRCAFPERTEAAALIPSSDGEGKAKVYWVCIRCWSRTNLGLVF